MNHSAPMPPTITTPQLTPHNTIYVNGQHHPSLLMSPTPPNMINVTNITHVTNTTHQTQRQ